MTHIWLGNFKSDKELESYLNQQNYLEAWAAYDHEAPTGNTEDDAEPDPGLRCLFCKETGLDTYDEDALIVKFYSKTPDITAVAGDILVSPQEMGKLYDKAGTTAFNAVIAYEDNNLTKAAASKSVTVKYLGRLRPDSGQDAASAEVHYLWVGDGKVDKKNILKQAGIDNDSVIKLNYHSQSKSVKLDEMLVLQVEDFNVAEKMILKVDKMKIVSAYAMLDLVMKGESQVKPEQVALALGMSYVGKFSKE